MRFLVREVELSTTAGRIIGPDEDAVPRQATTHGDTAHDALTRALRFDGGQILTCISEANGQELVATVRREEKMFQVELIPAKA